MSERESVNGADEASHPVSMPEFVAAMSDGLSEAAAEAVAPTRFRGPPPAVESLQGKIPGLRIERYVDEGGMGFVYKARHELVPDKFYAVKILREDGGLGDAEGRSRFMKEAKALATLAEGVAHFHDVGVIGDRGPLYITMQWIEGRDAAKIVQARIDAKLPGLSLEQALEIVIQTGRIVAAAHKQGIIHRDLKPANIILAGAGQLPPMEALKADDIRVVVLDFGLAHPTGDADGPLVPTQVGFTGGFAPPEQIDGGRQVDVWTDVYALAATFYNLLTGMVPVGRYKLPSQCAGVDRAVDAIIGKALSQAPADRQQTMAEFVDDLEGLRHDAAGPTPRRSPALLCLLGELEASKQELQGMAEALLRVSVGIELADGGGRPGLWLQAKTPAAGAACALRWLKRGSAHRVGAVAEELPNESAASAAQTAELAAPGQFLATQEFFDQVRVRGLADPGDDARRSARFLLHGRYTWPADLSGSGQESSEVIGQIGPVHADGLDPFRPPSPPAGGAFSLGEGDDWHVGEQLAAGEPAPHCPGWVLKTRLGRGSYGEVWLALHEEEGWQRAIKFCHDSKRLESFRREAGILAEIARAFPGDGGFSLLAAKPQLHSEPFSLQTEYCPEGNLLQWLESVGSASALPIEARLRLVAQVAALVAKTHDLGIIHRDLKPSNILIVRGHRDAPREVQPLLADFGLSGRDKTRLVAGGVENSPTIASLLKGNRMYGPPEERTSIPGDVYALGVLLFQIVADRFDIRPAHGWENAIDDPLLRQDIARAIDGTPANRPSARAFGEDLADFANRKRKAQAQLAQEAARRRLRNWLRVTAAAAVFLALAASIFGVQYFSKQAELSRKKEELSHKKEELSRKQAELAANELDLAKAAEKSIQASSDLLKVMQAVEAVQKGKSSAQITTIDFDSATQNVVTSFQWLARSHPERISDKDINELQNRLMFASTIVASSPIAGKGSIELIGQGGLDVSLLGLERAPGDLGFARTALYFAGYLGDLLKRSSSAEDRARGSEAYARALKAVDVIVSNPSADFADLFAAAKVCRDCAGDADAKGRKPLTLELCGKWLGAIKEARRWSGNNSSATRTLDEMAGTANSLIAKYQRH